MEPFELDGDAAVADAPNENEGGGADEGAFSAAAAGLAAVKPVKLPNGFAFVGG